MARTIAAPATWSGYPPTSDKHALCCVLKRLKFTEEAAKLIILDGYDEIAEYETMTDEVVERLVSNLRKPAAGTDGTLVSTTAETYLKQFAWVLRHNLRVSREVDLADVDTDWCRSMLVQKTMEDRWTTTLDTLTDGDYPKCDPNNYPRFFEDIVALLRRVRGRSGRILAYVVRDQIIPKDEDDDPPENYSSPDEEIIARAPIIVIDSNTEMDTPDLEFTAVGPFTPEFADDMTQVWDVLHKLLMHKADWVHAKPTKTTKNGRHAFFLIKKMVMGDQYVQRSIQKLERTITNLVYHGEKKQHDMKKYVQQHKECHVLASDLEELGYAGIDATSQVRHFLHGIKCEKLDAPKSNILSRAELQSDFDECARHMLDFIEATPSIQKGTLHGNLSAVRGDRHSDRHGRDRANGPRGAGMGSEADILAAMTRIEAQYTRNGQKFFVPTNDYDGMNKAERQAVFRIRQRLDGSRKPAARPNDGSGVSTKEHNKLKRSVAALSKQVKESSLDSDDGNLFSDNDEDDEDVKEVKSKKNKGNPALGKQGRKKGG